MVVVWRSPPLRGSASSGGDRLGLVEEACMSGPVWRKSSRSGSGGNDNCVEVAFAAPGVAVRDSKKPNGGRLAFPVSAWKRFVRR